MHPYLEPRDLLCGFCYRTFEHKVYPCLYMNCTTRPPKASHHTVTNMEIFTDKILSSCRVTDSAMVLAACITGVHIPRLALSRLCFSSPHARMRWKVEHNSLGRERTPLIEHVVELSIRSRTPQNGRPIGVSSLKGLHAEESVMSLCPNKNECSYAYATLLEDPPPIRSLDCYSQAWSI